MLVAHRQRGGRKPGRRGHHQTVTWGWQALSKGYRVLFLHWSVVAGCGTRLRRCCLAHQREKGSVHLLHLAATASFASHPSHLHGCGTFQTVWRELYRDPLPGFQFRPCHFSVIGDCPRIAPRRAGRGHLIHYIPLSYLPFICAPLIPLPLSLTFDISQPESILGVPGCVFPVLLHDLLKYTPRRQLFTSKASKKRNVDQLKVPGPKDVDTAPLPFPP